MVVTFNNTNHTAVSNSEGRWEARLPALQAGGPYTLSVRTGRRTQTISDILIGDVWLCSGQSNMADGDDGNRSRPR